MGRVTRVSKEVPFSEKLQRHILDVLYATSNHCSGAARVLTGTRGWSQTVVGDGMLMSYTQLAQECRQSVGVYLLAEVRSEELMM